MSANMRELFEEDSSSDEEPQQQQPSDSAGDSPSKRIILEEEDEDEDELTKRQEQDEPTRQEGTPEEEKEDVEMKDATEDPNETQSKEQAPVGGSSQADYNESREDDDDNDEDVEFDDRGEVVGSSAPARPPETTTDTSAQNTGGAAVPKSPQRAKKPRHIQVMEVEHPPPGTTLHMMKIPNLVGIQTEAFDPDTYSAALEERQFRDQHVYSMIRWRYARDRDTGELLRDQQGKLRRESNARVVKWNDGSYTLHVGTSEVFVMDKTDSSLSNGFAGHNGYLYLSQKATYRPDKNDDEDGVSDSVPVGTVLECMGAIQSRFAPRPTSLQSEAHKNLTVAVRQRTIKKARIAEYVTQEDPEKAKLERIKIKQDMEKTSARKNRTYHRASVGSGGGGRRSTPGMNRRYLEEAEDERNYDSINIRALKRSNTEELMDYGDDSDEDEDDDENPVWAKSRRRPMRSRARREEPSEEEDESEEEFGLDEEEDEEEEVFTKKPSTGGKKRTHQAVVDDDDDDED